MAVRVAIDNLEDSGVFTHALREWRSKTLVQQESLALLQTHFKAADKERRRILTPKDVGYANKASDKPIHEANSAVIPNGKGKPMYYCWSHGLGTNSNHTSKKCTKKAPGHRAESTADDMLGGCCIIRRKAGERAVYRRPQRERQGNDENRQPPTNP
ncbi:hypothetical protein SEMRO_2814_G337710.1 [Seminavis robusta]|uniref:Uncharacterized protein n=1 Tax=Seminavis robusta TaxID=568900 RepID=A0A9N8F2C5_9STRA|nr:hypothetical protein SEMRO_2814_G337710.1 [Seminavis robusta]|eukprot:Sro2814_g337710.1 n/a (157) ;mRNA; r:7600-8070